MLVRAVKLRPSDGYIVDSLGWVYYRLGRFDEAVVQLERAVALRPQDPTINDHLGDALWQVGRRHEARFQWHRALSLDPKEDPVPLIEKKLEEGVTIPPENIEPRCLACRSVATPPSARPSPSRRGPRGT